MINILKMFGPASVLDQYRLQLVINLKDASNSEIKKVDRIAPSLVEWEMLGFKVPCLTMLVAAGKKSFRFGRSRSSRSFATYVWHRQQCRICQAA